MHYKPLVRYANPGIFALLLFTVNCNSLLSEVERIRRAGEGHGCEAPAPGAVTPVYANAANWGQHIRNDGTSPLDATGTPCTGSEGGLANSCLHGGELRRVPITNRQACEGISGSDALGAFKWRCAMVNGVPNLVTGGLDDERYLSHLLDFSGAGSWRTNAVTVTDSCGSASTARSAWHTNTLVKNFTSAVSPTNLTLSSNDTIYLFSTNPAKSLYLTGNRSALVSLPGLVLSAAGIATHANSDADFCWIELTLDATGASASSLDLAGTNFCTVRGSNFAHREVRLGAAQNLRWSYNRVFNERVYFGAAVSGLISSHFILTNGRWYLDSGNNHNHVSVDLTLVGSDYGYSTGNMQSYFGHVVINHTGANFTVQGVRGGPINDSTFMNILYANYQGTGFGTSGSRNTVINVALGSGDGRISASGDHEYFTGQVRYGQTNTLCSAGAGSPGIDAGCMAQNGSDFTLTTSLNFSSAIAGRVLSDDSANLADTSGLANYTGLADFFRFASRYRGYSREAAAAHFAVAHRGSCSSGSCRIWDMQLTAADSQLRGVLSLPTATDIFYHRWQAAGVAACTSIKGALWQPGACTLPAQKTVTACTAAGGTWQTGICASRALRNAFEIFNDARGNDNGLCESGEACIFTPNFGAYQGHGALVYVTAISGANTEIQNVDLWRYRENGR